MFGLIAYRQCSVFVILTPTPHETASPGASIVKHDSIPISAFSQIGNLLSSIRLTWDAPASDGEGQRPEGISALT